MKKIILRPAIAMIELIFALTVMGIVMLSIPNLLGMASSSSYTSLQQEAIATAASDISILLSRQWDEADTDQDKGEPVLGVANGGNLGVASNDGYSRSNNTNNNSAPDSATTPANLGKDGTTADPFGDDDVDDIDTNPTKLTTSTGSKTGNIDNTIEIATTVTYISDVESSGDWRNSTIITYNYPLNPVAQASSTNIKQISVNLTSDTGMEELDKDITLFAFSCNIGGFKRERRIIE